jgi:hypothetical protein
MRLEGVPGDDLSRHWMRSLRPRSDARFAHDDDRAAAITGLNRALAAHPMVRSCVPNAWRISRAAVIDRDGVCTTSRFQNRRDLIAGTASGCMRWLGGTTPEAGVDLLAMLAPEGAAWDCRRGRSFSALMGVMAVGCVPRDGTRGRCPRFRSHQDGGRMCSR